MPVLVACECGQSFELRDEFRGRTVRCPHCSRVTTAGDPLPEDPVFGRDVFLLRQKALAISEKYFVNDEQGKVLLFVKRPARLFKGILALLASIALAMLVAVLLFLAAALMGESVVGGIIATLTPLMMMATFFLATLALMPKRHVTFHAGMTESDPVVLAVVQNRRLEFPTRTFTIVDGTGTPLATLQKNVFTNLFRKKWLVRAASGRPLVWIKEDSVILSLLRRLLGPLFGLLRTNFVYMKVGSSRVLGEFKRKLTILDRYVLDLSADGERYLDRRVAIATAVMLDTAERR